MDPAAPRARADDASAKAPQRTRSRGGMATSVFVRCVHFVGVSLERPARALVCEHGCHVECSEGTRAR